MADEEIPTYTTQDLSFIYFFSDRIKSASDLIGTRYGIAPELLARAAAASMIEEFHEKSETALVRLYNTLGDGYALTLTNAQWLESIVSRLG